MVSSVFREETPGKRPVGVFIHWMDASLDPNPRKLTPFIEQGVQGFVVNGGEEVDPRMLACGTPIGTNHDEARLATCSDISYNAEVSNFRHRVTEENLAHVLKAISRSATLISWINRARVYYKFLTCSKRCAQERNLYRRIRREGYSIQFNLVRRIIGSFQINLNESHNLLLDELGGRNFPLL